MTSNSKWFSCIADHVAGIRLLRVSDLSRYIDFVFADVIFDTQKVKIAIIKQIHMHFSFITQKQWFSVVFGFSFWALYPKTKTWKSRKPIKNPEILTCEYVTSKTLEILFKQHQNYNDSATLLIMQQLFGFLKHLTPLNVLNWARFCLCQF